MVVTRMFHDNSYIRFVKPNIVFYRRDFNFSWRKSSMFVLLLTNLLQAAIIGTRRSFRDERDRRTILTLELP